MKKFKSLYALESEMYKTGLNRPYNDILDMLKMEEKGRGYGRMTQKKLEERVLEWWNNQETKPDIEVHRPSYVLLDQLRNAYKRKAKLNRVI